MPVMPSGLSPATMGALTQVQITIDEIERIATTVVAAAEADASHSSTGFANLDISEASFSEVPLARQMASQHQAAHDVFVATVKGVVADLRDFQGKLIASAKAHRGNDDAVYATLVAVGHRYRRHEYHSDQNRQQRTREYTPDADEPEPSTRVMGGRDQAPATTAPPAGAGDDRGAAPDTGAPSDGTSY